MKVGLDTNSNRNPAIEGLRILLMFGICMCHSIGAGGYCYVPLRNICMMCTVGFIFITGWFGVTLKAQRIVRLFGIAFFALGVVVVEDLLLNGQMTMNLIRRATQWWFLNSYLMLLGLSPILNSIVACAISTDAKVRREGWLSVLIVVVAIYGLSWPMHCKWTPQVGFFLTIGCPCQFGTMCVIYLLARMVRVSGSLDKVRKPIWQIALAISCGLAMYSHKFSYYNSPVAFLFALSVFALVHRVAITKALFSKAISAIAPSMFFVYLYHSHYNPGFMIIKNSESWMVNNGIPIPFAWITMAVCIFFVGILLDLARRYIFKITVQTNKNI